MNKCRCSICLKNDIKKMIDKTKLKLQNLIKKFKWENTIP